MYTQKLRQGGVWEGGGKFGYFFFFFFFKISTVTKYLLADLHRYIESENCIYLYVYFFSF